MTLTYPRDLKQPTWPYLQVTRTQNEFGTINSQCIYNVFPSFYNKCFSSNPFPWNLKYTYFCVWFATLLYIYTKYLTSVTRKKASYFGHILPIKRVPVSSYLPPTYLDELFCFYKICHMSIVIHASTGEPKIKTELTLLHFLTPSGVRRGGGDAQAGWLGDRYKVN